MGLEYLDKDYITSILNKRKGEIKVGEQLHFATKEIWENLEKSKCKFVILGIEEDIGPRANLGNGGADKAWEAFLKAFINTQSNTFIDTHNILVLGKITIQNTSENNIDALRQKVAELDDVVFPIIQKIVSNNKIPIVIGGGHNNCYPLLKGASLGLNKSVNCINCDPHADYRALEGRHSGNGFSYAKSENYLDKYSIIGLHENYNSSSMIHQLKTDGIKYLSYEEIFVRKEISYNSALKKCIKEVGADEFGVELDMDSIEGVPASAKTPSGISVKEARQYIHSTAKHKNAIYLHLPEAAPSEDAIEKSQIGKLLSYLAIDFIKSNQG